MNLPFKPLTFLAACLFSCVVVLPFVFPSESGQRTCALEMEFVTDTFGYAQIYYDEGHGFSEGNSVRLAIQPGDELASIRFPLPAGTLRAIRFDPTDRHARLSFRHAQITASDGVALHRFSSADFHPQQQIARFEVESATTRVVTDERANDPILDVTLERPVHLETASILAVAARFAAIVFAVVIALLAAIRSLPDRFRLKLAAAGSNARRTVAAHPARAVMLIAVGAVGLSSYPVVFLGKSFVSPNFSDGTYLLYERFPTLPGYADTTTEGAKGSDVGAMFWADVPYSFVQSRALLHDHELPLWNRYNSAGTVFFAQGQSMFGDPLHLLVLLANGAAWAWDLKFLVAKWLLCAGLGLCVLHGTRQFASAALAALSAAFLGFFVFRLNHPAFFSFCYAPWILYAWLRLANAGRLRTLAGWCGALIVANVAEMHSGTAKEAYMLLLSLNFSGACVLFATRSGRDRLVAFACAGWAGLLFALLTAPTWLTFLDALKQAYTTYNFRTAFQIQPSVALGFFDEIFYRPLIRDEKVFGPSANFVVLVGLLYFIATFRHAARSRAARWLAWSTLPPLALAFGLVPPSWIVRLPFLGNVAHIDNSFSCVLIILSVVLAGYGWSSLFVRLPGAEARGDLTRVAWLFALLVWPWIAFTQTVHRPIYGEDETVTLLHWGQRLPVSAFVWFSLLALPAAVALLLFALRRSLAARHVDASGAMLITLALAVLLWRPGVHSAALGPADYVFTPSSRADFHASSPGIVALKAHQSEPGRVVGIGSNLFPGWSGVYGLEGISGPDALMNPLYFELLNALPLERIWGWRIYTTPASLATEKPALDFLNVRHYVELHSPQPQYDGVLKLVEQADLDVYESASAWPRAFFAAGVIPYDHVADLASRIQRSAGAPFAALERSDLERLASLYDIKLPVATAAATRPATEYHLTTNTTEFTINATGPGVAVLHEAWLPHSFRATLNGQRVSVLRVNHAFKGVAIPAAGTYRVSFTYRPSRFYLSLGLSGAGLLLAFLSSLAVRRFDRPLASLANA